MHDETLLSFPLVTTIARLYSKAQWGKVSSALIRNRISYVRLPGSHLVIRVRIERS